MTAVACPFCGSEHTAGTFVCPTTNRRLQGLVPVNTIIDDKYRIDGIIGVGGMGVVYRAEHTKIGRQVALKMLLPEYIVYPDLVARVEREARTAGQIDHPNVVSIVDLGVTSEQGPYIAMELLRGQELATTVERAGGRLDPAEAVDILRQVLSGLDAAHKKGVIHRDLKPENIFLTLSDDGGRGVKVLDFGISKLRDDSQLNSLTRTGTVMGTPQFMAPEQAAGARDQDARIDLYAAGAVLYAVLCNGLPYEAENYNLLISEILNKPPIQILSRNTALDPRLASVVMKSISKKPEQRFQSARAMADALSQWYEIRNTPRTAAVRLPGGGRSSGMGSADATAPIELRRNAGAMASAMREVDRGSGRGAGYGRAPEALVEIDDNLSPDDPAYIDRNEATLVVPLPFTGDTQPAFNEDDLEDLDDSAPRPSLPAPRALAALPAHAERRPSPLPPSNPPGASPSNPPGSSQPSLPELLLESPLDAPPIVLPTTPKPPPTDEAWARLRTGSSTSARYKALDLDDLAPKPRRWWLLAFALVVLAAGGIALARYLALRRRAEGNGAQSLTQPTLPTARATVATQSAPGAPPAGTTGGVTAPGGNAQDPDAEGRRHHHHHEH